MSGKIRNPERRCPECGRGYTPRVRQQRYCSRLCRNAAVVARLAALDERHFALGVPVTRRAGARGNMIENRGRIPGGTGAEIWRPE